MKTLRKLLYCTILAALTIAFACDKENEEEKDDQLNYFIIGGEEYSLDKGYIEPYGENDNGSYDFDLIIVSSGIQYSPSSESFFGTGHFVYLDVHTSSGNGLVNGTYNYSSVRNSFTFVDGEVGMNVDVANETGDLHEIVGGTLKVSVEENLTTIDFQLTTSNNQTIEGNFHGVFSFI